MKVTDKSLFIFIGLFFFSLSSSAATLKTLSWQEGEGQPTLRVAVDGKATFSTSELQGGQRLRVTLENTKLPNNPLNIGSKGIVKSVAPFASDDGRSVHIDILVSEPSRLEVNRRKNIYLLVIKPINAPSTTPSTHAHDAPKTVASNAYSHVKPNPISSAPTKDHSPSNILKNIKFDTLSGGRVLIKLNMTHQPAEPGSFSINKPARIALDFFDTQSSFGSKTIPVELGVVETISAIESQGRTRIVLNLLTPVGYKTKIEPDGLVITIDGSTNQANQPVKKTGTVNFAKPTSDGSHTLEGVDFRRGAKGEGKVIINLSDDTTGIDIKEQSGEIVIDLLNTNLPDKLERRLDVVDFATPVRTIDTFRFKNSTRLIIQASGRFDHLAYQSGNVLTIEVKPFGKEEEEKRKADEFGYYGETLSLNFQNIEVRAALRVIADFTGLNFVTSDTVKGTLTLRLKDVPWDQALDIILSAKGLAKRAKGNVIWVAPAEEIAEKEKIALKASKAVADLEPLVSELILINYAKASDIAELLKSVKSILPQDASAGNLTTISVESFETVSNSLLSPRGNVTVDARTNSLLVQDTRAQIRSVKKLIAKLDRPVEQVMIETRIVEASDDFSRSIGARFGITNRNRSLNIPGSPGTNAGDAVLTGQLENATDIYNEDTYLINGAGLNVNLPSPGVDGDPAGSIAFTLFKIASTHLLALELSALESEGRGKIIASPRLVTANDKEARIEQGEERVVISTSSLGGTTAASGSSTRFTVIEAKLSLTVTPHITPDDSVILDVNITKDNFNTPTGPAKDTKSIKTQVLLNNGETVVIGGIYQQEMVNTNKKIPLLGDIPILGNFFRKKEKLDNKVELLIFLTPRILAQELKSR